jgi:hypothetical protein
MFGGVRSGVSEDEELQGADISYDPSRLRHGQAGRKVESGADYTFQLSRKIR